MSVPRRLLSTTSPLTLGIVAAAGVGLAAYNVTSNKASNISPAQPQKSLGPRPTFPASGFVNLVLEDARMVNHDTKELRFKLPGEDGGVSGLGVVSSLLTRHTAQGSWIPTFRPYTPISDPTSPHVTLLVKHYPNGAASTHLHNLTPGQTLSVKALPEFDYKPNQHKELVLVAGGAGITPMLQVLNTALRNTEDKTQMKLIYANKSEADILLKSELDTLAAEYPSRFQATYVVTDPKAADKGYQTGYVTKEILGKALGEKAEGVKVLVCGPPPMMAAVAGAKGMRGWTQGRVGGMLKELGVTEEQLHKF